MKNKMSQPRQNFIFKFDFVQDFTRQKIVVSWNKIHYGGPQAIPAMTGLRNKKKPMQLLDVLQKGLVEYTTTRR